MHFMRVPQQLLYARWVLRVSNFLWASLQVRIHTKTKSNDFEGKIGCSLYTIQFSIQKIEYQMGTENGTSSLFIPFFIIYNADL